MGWVIRRIGVVKSFTVLFNGSVVEVICDIIRIDYIHCPCGVIKDHLRCHANFCNTFLINPSSYESHPPTFGFHF